MCYTLVRGSFYQIWSPSGISYQFDLWSTLADPYMTLDPSNALYSSLGYFPPNLVAIGHFQANWPLEGPGWPLHDLWPHQCITLWSGILPKKIWGTNVISKQFDLWLTPADPSRPLTPSMHYTLVWGCFYQFGGHRVFLRNLTSGWSQVTPAWPLTPAVHYALVRVFLTNLVAIGHL